MADPNHLIFVISDSSGELRAVPVADGEQPVPGAQHESVMLLTADRRQFGGNGLTVSDPRSRQPPKKHRVVDNLLRFGASFFSGPFCTSMIGGRVDQ